MFLQRCMWRTQRTQQSSVYPPHLQPDLQHFLLPRSSRCVDGLRPQPRVGGASPTCAGVCEGSDVPHLLRCEATDEHHGRCDRRIISGEFSGSTFTGIGIGISRWLESSSAVTGRLFAVGQRNELGVLDVLKLPRRVLGQQVHHLGWHR